MVRSDLFRILRGVYFRFLHLPQVRQDREPVVVRFAHGDFRHSNEFLAFVYGLEAIGAAELEFKKGPAGVGSLKFD